MTDEAPHLLVHSDTPTKTVLHTTAPPGPLAEGEVAVHISKLVVTANTVTYAIAGNMPMLTYFKHFSTEEVAPEGLSMSPCWGHGVVVDSRVPEVQVGTRLHGLYPFSRSVVLSLRPGPSPTTFLDVTPHRKGMFEPYLTYMTAEDPFWKGASYEKEDYLLSTGILFSTGWSMAQTAAIHEAGPTALVLTSASSRTSRAAAFAARFHKLPLKVLGLTSASNLDYVKGLGLYDEVVVYGEESSLGVQKVVVQDVAGNPAVRERLYRHFGEQVVSCGVVGIAHASSAGQTANLEGLGGAPPKSFLVFQALEEVAAAMGKQERNLLLAAGSKAYNDSMFPQFHCRRHFGPKATQQVFDQTVTGTVDPKVTQVCSLWPEALHEPTISSFSMTSKL